MRIAYLNWQVAPAGLALEDLLDAWATLREVPAALARAGLEVEVLQAAAGDAVLQHQGVRYRLVADPALGRRGSIARLVRRPRRMIAAARSVRPDLVHLQGLAFPGPTRALCRALPSTPVLVQDHGGRPPGGLRRLAYRWGFRKIAGVAFTAREQAEPFRRAGVLPSEIAVFEVLESSSHFVPGDRTAARAATGLFGNPCLLWVGHLDANKDPLTVLAALRQAMPHLEDPHLWCCYRRAPLLPAVRRLLAGDPELGRRVHLLGAVPHPRVELLARAADFLVSGSHREGSGYAVLEALACGTPVLVTDIPAFRRLTAGGQVGALSPPGDAPRMAQALVAWAHRDQGPLRAEVRRHFERALSFAVVAADLVATYRALGGRLVKVGLVVPGGVDRSGERRVIPALLWLIERLARRHEVLVFALFQEPRPCRYPLLGATVCNIGRPATRLRALAAIGAEHRRAPFQVLHGFWASPAGLLAVWAGAWLRRPAMIHLAGGELVALPDIAYGAQRRLRGRLWVRLALAGADVVTAASGPMLAAARHRGARPVRLPLGVDLVRWPPREPRPREPGRPARLIQVASLNAVKDQATLLKAVALVRNGGRPVQLDLVGEDCSGGALARLAAELGLSEVVRFHGFLTHRELRPLMEAQDLFVLSSRHEAGPVAMLEAAVSGVPTVGTAVGQVRDWAPEAAVAVPVGDHEALAQGVLALLDDEPRRLRLARAAQARAVAEDADWTARRVESLYRQLERGAR